MISRSRIRKASSSARNEFAAGACLILGVLLILFSPGPPPSRAESVPEWLTAAGRVDLGRFGDGSGAAIVSDWTEFLVDATGKFVETERRAMRVFNRRAADRFLNAVGHENSDTKVTSIQTWAISSSGHVTPSSKKDIISSPAIAGFELFDDSRVKAVQIPGAEDGALVGYEIVTQGHIPINGEVFLMENEIPIRTSELHVSVPSGTLRWFVNYPDRVEVVNSSATAASFRTENRPAVPEEEDTPPLSSLAAEVVINYDPKGSSAVHTWEEAGNEYHVLFNNAEKPEGEIALEVDALETSQTDDLAKIEALYNYVSRQIRYVAIEIGIGGYQPHQAADVFKYKYGDCKDKANLLISMLNKIGVRSFPALVGTRGDVEADPKIPTLTTFDHMIVALPVSESLRPAVERLPAYDAQSKLLWMDPTSEVDPLGELPEMDQGVFALVAYPDHGSLLRIPEAPLESNGAQYSAHVRLQPDGMGLAEVELKYMGANNARAHYFYRGRSNAEILKVFEARVTNYVNDARFQRASISGVEDSRQQVQEKYSFSGDFSSASSGDTWFFQPLFLSGIDNAEFGPRPRKLPLDFGTPRRFRGEYTLELPTGMRLERIPEKVLIKSDFGELDVEYAMDGNVLRAKLTLSYTQSRIPPEQYPAFRDFRNSCLRAERQRLRLVKAPF
jgi:hypothetical protein